MHAHRDPHSPLHRPSARRFAIFATLVVTSTLAAASVTRRSSGAAAGSGGELVEGGEHLGGGEASVTATIGDLAQRPDREQ